MPGQWSTATTAAAGGFTSTTGPFGLRETVRAQIQPWTLARSIFHSSTKPVAAEPTIRCSGPPFRLLLDGNNRSPGAAGQNPRWPSLKRLTLEIEAMWPKNSTDPRRTPRFGERVTGAVLVSWFSPKVLHDLLPQGSLTFSEQTSRLDKRRLLPPVQSNSMLFWQRCGERMHRKRRQRPRDIPSD